MSFESANDLNINFYIWQHFPKNLPDTIQRTFKIGEQVGPKYQLIFLDQKNESDNLISTYVETKLRQQFDYKTYPFDNKIIYLSIWSKSYDQNIVLIPDFSAYRISAKDFIGMDPNLVLKGFIVKTSYFGYKPSDYETNFGRQRSSFNEKEYPYFYFAIVLKRSLFSAFVLHVLPLVIGYILLFSILMMNTEKKYKLIRFRFTGTDVIMNCALLFFVLVVVHVGLRAKLYSDQIIYLEYFYLMIYILIGCVVLNNYIILSDTKKKVRFLHYADNLIPKVLFWPLVWLATLIISTITLPLR